MASSRDARSAYLKLQNIKVSPFSLERAASAIGVSVDQAKKIFGELAHLGWIHRRGDGFAINEFDIPIRRSNGAVSVPKTKKGELPANWRDRLQRIPLNSSLEEVASRLRVTPEKAMPAYSLLQEMRTKLF
jgi:hypothetical protein